MTDRAAIPSRIGPVEFGELGRLIAVTRERIGAAFSKAGALLGNRTATISRLTA
jgi:hypothetical protein